MRELIADVPGRRLELLCEHDELHATRARFAPGVPGADLHVHRLHTDVFYVLAGELTVLHEHGEIAVAPGTFACVPPLVGHGFANRSDAEVEYLNFHAPGVGFADYLRALVRGEAVPFDQEPPPASGARPFSDATIATRTSLALGAARRTFGFGAVDGVWAELPADAATLTLAV